MRTRMIILLGSAGLALTGCASLDPPVIAAGDVPKAWTLASSGGAAPSVSAWPDRGWWEGFKSAELSGLLYEAQARSFDIEGAALRVVRAEASAASVSSRLWPSLALSGGASRRDGFDEGSSESASLSTSLALSYEADLWGELRAGRRSAYAALAASRFDQASVALTVTSGVGSAYLQVLSVRDRTMLAKRNIEISEKLLALVESRVRNGAAPPLDLAQQQAAAARQRARLPGLEQEEREALSALALLIGRPASGFAVAGTGLDNISVPMIEAGLPSELLSRRPDIARAEANLSAANADIAAARAALLPSISLSGSAGGSSASLASLLDPAATAWSLGSSLAVSVFDAGAKRAAITSATAARDELLLAYREAALTAFSEVDLDLTARSAIERERAEREIEAASARTALRLAEVRYREGADNIDGVLSAQSALFSAEETLLQIKLEEALAAITLYRVLGGGWSRSGEA